MKNKEIIREMLEKGRAIPIGVDEPCHNALVCCARAEGFNWDLDSNWINPDLASAPRDLQCNHCNQQLAVSHYLYRQYEAGDFTAEQFHCVECIVAKSMN